MRKEMAWARGVSGSAVAEGWGLGVRSDLCIISVVVGIFLILKQDCESHS